MNPRVRNMQKTSDIKNYDINLENVHFVGLCCLIVPVSCASRILAVRNPVYAIMCYEAFKVWRVF